MTSLQNQLKRLAVPTAEVSGRGDVVRVSLLFDKKKAQSLKSDTIYSLGINGLDDLNLLDPSFHTLFYDQLFSESSKKFERTIQTKEVNAKLDKYIEHFLIKLSPYILTRPAHKCLEWLLYRYQIHAFNVDAIFAAILPYHRTNIFVRIVQMLNIADNNCKWNWVSPIQKPGIPLPTSYIVAACNKDTSILHFVCNLVPKILKMLKNAKGIDTLMRPFIRFQTSVLLASVEASSDVSNNFLSQLMPFLVQSLKYDLMEYTASTYLVISHVCFNTTFTEKIATSLTEMVVKSFDQSIFKQCLATVIVICETQSSIKSLSPELVSRLITEDNFLENLILLHNTSHINRFLDLALKSAVKLAFTSDDQNSDIKHTEILKKILQNIGLCETSQKTLICLIFDECEKCGFDFNNEKSDLILTCQRKFPNSFDAAVSDKFAACNKETMKSFTKIALSSVSHQTVVGSETSLLLSFSHPEPSIRISGLKYLETLTLNNPKLIDQAFVKDAVLGRLNDEDNYAVMQQVLAFVEKFPSCLFHDENVACLILSKLIVKQNRGNPTEGKGIGRNAMNLIFDNVNLTKKEKSTKFLVKASLIEYICANIVLKHGDNVSNAMKLYQSVHADCISWQSSNETTMAGIMQCIISTFNSANDIIMLLNGVKQIASLCNLPFHKMASFTLLLKCGLNSAQNLEALDSRIILSYVLKEVSEGLVEHFDLAFDANSDYQDVEVFEMYATALYNAGHEMMKLSSTCLLHCFHFIITMLGKQRWKENVVWCKVGDDTNKLYDETLLALLLLENKVISKQKTQTNLKNAVQNLLKSFIKSFGSPLAFILYTVPLWTMHLDFYPHKNQFVMQTSQMQLFAIVNSLLNVCKDKKEDRSELLAHLQANSEIIASLLLACSTDNETIRKMVVKSFKTIHSFSSENKCDGWLESLLATISENSREIISDKVSTSKYLQQAVAGDKSVIGKQILERFSKDILCNENVPTYVKYNFVKDCLAHVNLVKISSEVAKEIMKYQEVEFDLIEEHYLNVLIKKVTSSSLKVNACKEAFIKIMNMERFVKTSPQITAIGVINKEFFEHLTNQNQQDILNVLVTLSAQSKNSILTTAITKSLKVIKIESEQIFEVLELVTKGKMSDTPSSTVAVKRARYQKTKQKAETDGLSEDNRMNWKKVTVVLEMIQHKKKLKSSEVLIQPLFGVLGALMNSETLEEELQENYDDDDVIEYRKQIILNSLINICQKLKKLKDAKEVLTPDKFKVELLVYCIRTSNNLQTQQHALLLLAEATTVCPEDVLHNVMAIFTFVGTHTVRQDNEMSYQIISKTITTILPAMLKNTGNKAATKLSLLKIISVFVNAFPHIPSHRRLPVFEELLKSLGQDDHLWMTIVLLIEQFTNKPTLKTNADSTETDVEDHHPPQAKSSFTMNEVVENWFLICAMFDVRDQVLCMIKIVEFLINLDIDIENKSSTKSTFRSKIELIDVRLHSLKQLRRLKLACLYFLSYILTQNRNNNIFDFQANHNAAVKSDSAAKLTILFRRLLEVLLAYIDGTTLCMKEMEQDTQDYKFNKVLLHKSYELIEQINTILPTGTFLLTLQGLLQHKAPSTRKRAMEMLSERINNAADTFMKEEKSVLLKLVDELKKVIRPKDITSERTNELQSTSWHCLKAVVHLCAKQNPGNFVDIFPIISDLLSTYQDTDLQVVVSALLCLAELSVSLKIHCIPHLPNIMPSLMNLLKKKETLESDNVVFACLAALHRILENLADFMSPYLEDVIIRITALKLIERYHEDITGSKDTMISHISLRLHSLFQIVATKLPTRVLLPSLKNCKEQILNRRPKCMEYLAEISSSHVASLSKSDLNKNVAQLGEFYIDCLNYRVDIATKDLNVDNVNDIEDAIISSTITMLLKLPENTFRPLFFKLYNWACLSGNDSVKKLITFYRLNLLLAEKLKSLYAMFSGILLSNIVEVMKGEGFNGEEKYFLLQTVVDVMSMILKYDTSDFLTKERFQLLLMPFVNHLEDLALEDSRSSLSNHKEEVVESFVKDHLVPCFGEIASACNDESNWKSLNFQVLLKTKSSYPKVQYFALAAMEIIAEKLGEDYMLLLPESIPFFAELMEDGNEMVEEACHAAIRKLEKILGEDLQKYF